MRTINKETNNDNDMTEQDLAMEEEDETEHIQHLQIQLETFDQEQTREALQGLIEDSSGNIYQQATYTARLQQAIMDDRVYMLA